MFEELRKVIKKYSKLVDDIFVDFLQDMKSLRYQLVIWAFILNFYVLTLVADGKADYKLAGITVGLLTIVYTLYFASKHNEAHMKNGKNEEDEEL
jgi:hypothetical protein